MNEGHITFSQINPELDLKIINGNLINPNEVDESLPFGISEFLRLPIFN